MENGKVFHSMYESMCATGDKELQSEYLPVLQ